MLRSSTLTFVAPLRALTSPALKEAYVVKPATEDVNVVGAFALLLPPPPQPDAQSKQETTKSKRSFIETA